MCIRDSPRSVPGRRSVLTIVCTVHLINEGIAVHGNNVTAQFVGVGTAISYLCRLDSQLFKNCNAILFIHTAPLKLF